MIGRLEGKEEEAKEGERGRVEGGREGEEEEEGWK